MNLKPAHILAGALALATFPAAAAHPSVEFPSPGLNTTLHTNIAQVRSQAHRLENAGCTVSLDGVVLWVSPAHDQFVLADDSGRIRVDSPNLARQVGQRVRLEGSAIAGHTRLRAPLIDNDGLHPASEKSETIYLEPGRQPIRAEWFNGPGGFELAIPCLHRQPIPSALLFRSQIATPAPHGLDYSCFEGVWENLPDFGTLSPTKSGVTTNFDLAMRTRDQNVALLFTGYLEIPHEGLYTFWLRSDDGGRLFVGDSSLHLTDLGSAPQPPPPQQ